MRSVNAHKNRNLTLKANTKGRDFIVGDLHGCYSQLKKALKKVKFNKKKDRLISVGDLINKGYENLECLSLIEKDWFYAVLGNHEILMIESILYKKNRADFYAKGGSWIKNLSKKKRRIVKNLVKTKLALLPHSITLDLPGMKIGICHGDPPPNWRSAEKGRASSARMTFGRSRIQKGAKSKIKNVDAVFVGHTPQPSIKVLGNVVYIDTAPHLKNGRLTLIECPRKNIYRFLKRL